MTIRTKHSTSEALAADPPLEEIVQELLAETRLISAVATTLVLFRADDGSFSDLDATVSIDAGDTEHPVVLACARGKQVNGAWEAGGGSGTAFPIALASRSDVVVWIGVDETVDVSESSEREFLIERALERFARQIRLAAGAWSDERRQAALRCALTAAARFHKETSLHRALRLAVTDLGELAGAIESSAWKIEPTGEPACVAHANARLSTPQREEAVRRLAAETQSSHGAVRVLDTARSDHYAWCASQGITRFIAQPIRAFDALYGVLIVVNFDPAPRLVGGGLAPGVETASGIVAEAAASAFHQVARDTRASELEKQLRNTRRQLERMDRAAARLDLARRAADELEVAIGHLIDLETAEAAAETDPALARAADVLAELRALTESPGARLRMTSINDAVHDAVTEVRNRPGMQPVEVSVRLQGDLPKLLLDGEKIREMLVNLIEHGTSGTEKREAVVVSRLHKGEVIVEIRFPERDVPGGVLESLFLPFSEEEDAKGRLGLALADQIIGEHGGQLRAKREGEDGLCYWLSLPIADNQERRRQRADRRRTERRRVIDDAA